MNVDDLHVVDRPAAFPIYSFECDGLVKPNVLPVEYEPGRNVLFGYMDPETRKVDRSIEEKLGPNDIVYVPLYIGENPERVSACDGTHQKLDCYDHNMEFLVSIAPRVKAILVGNAGPELSFKHLCMNPTGCTRMHMMDEMCRFVDETSTFIRAAGGRPAYGPVDWDLCIDAYFCDGRYRNHCRGKGIIQIVYCGFQLFALGKDRLPDYPMVPHYSDKLFWPMCPRQEGPPWPQLTEYIRGYDEIVSGLEFITGFQRGNDIVLAKHGFKAGLCGGLVLPESSDPVTE